MEHLFITYENGIYFLNAENGYKIYDKTVAEDERTYWIKISLGYKPNSWSYEAITEEEVERLEELKAEEQENGIENY